MRLVGCVWLLCESGGGLCYGGVLSVWWWFVDVWDGEVIAEGVGVWWWWVCVCVYVWKVCVCMEGVSVCVYGRGVCRWLILLRFISPGPSG